MAKTIQQRPWPTRPQSKPAPEQQAPQQPDKAKAKAKHPGHTHKSLHDYAAGK